MTNEKAVRTREEQVADHYSHDRQTVSMIVDDFEDAIREAEARGAAQAWAEDAKGQEPIAYTSQIDLDRVKKGKSGDIYGSKSWEGSSDEVFAIPLYTRPTNVAALEARIKELEAQLKKVTTPTWYCCEGDEEGAGDISDAIEHIDPFYITEVDGCAKVNSFWAFNDENYKTHIFNTKKEAVSALAVMSKEGGETP